MRRLIKAELIKCGYNNKTAEKWLKTPHRELEGSTPDSLISAGAGQVVLDLVIAIGSGTPS